MTAEIRNARFYLKQLLTLIDEHPQRHEYSFNAQALMREADALLEKTSKTSVFEPYYQHECASPTDRVAWALCQIIDDDAPLRWTRYRFAADCLAAHSVTMQALNVLAERSSTPKPLAYPLSEYHEDRGPVVWWCFPVTEPGWIGTPNDSDWPGYHTHWTPHPPVPQGPK